MIRVASSKCRLTGTFSSGNRGETGEAAMMENDLIRAKNDVDAGPNENNIAR